MYQIDLKLLQRNLNVKNIWHYLKITSIYSNWANLSQNLNAVRVLCDIVSNSYALYATIKTK